MIRDSYPQKQQTKDNDEDKLRSGATNGLKYSVRDRKNLIHVRDAFSGGDTSQV